MMSLLGAFIQQIASQSEAALRGGDPSFRKGVTRERDQYRNVDREQSEYFDVVSGRGNHHGRNSKHRTGCLGRGMRCGRLCLHPSLHVVKDEGATGIRRLNNASHSEGRSNCLEAQCGKGARRCPDAQPDLPDNQVYGRPARALGNDQPNKGEENRAIDAQRAAADRVCPQASRLHLLAPGPF